MRVGTLALAAAIAPLLLFSLFGADIASASSGASANSSSNVPWAYQMQNQQNTGYSPETRINAANVGTLVPAWTTTPLNNLAGTPVVSHGMVYVAGPPYLYGIDEKTGAIVWKDGPGSGGAPLDFRTAAGVTVDQGSVYAATFQNSLVAINAKTGALEWTASINSTLTGDLYPYKGAEATPLIWNGIVVVGETSGDVGPSRGVIQGFSETNGSHLWTFYLVPPGPVNATNQAAYGNTWGTNGTTGCICGGGAQWNVPAVDPKTGVIYFGTGNPYPTDNPFVREPSSADTNLYTECVIALNVRTGQLVWYHQETNPEYFDWDQGMPVQLFYTNIDHVSTEVVGVGGKAGYYFELNAATGAVIYQTALGIHLNDNVPANDITKAGITVYPGNDGGINTFSSYNPTTNKIYSVAANIPAHCHLSSGLIQCPNDDKIAPNSTLYAIDASTGAISWSINLALLGGGVSSADNLIFFADGNHEFYAASAATGKTIWQYNDPTGNPGLFSWGPPSIADGYVFWETYGLAKDPGHVIAFALSDSESARSGASNQPLSSSSARSALGLLPLTASGIVVPTFSSQPMREEARQPR